MGLRHSILCEDASLLHVVVSSLHSSTLCVVFVSPPPRGSLSRGAVCVSAVPVPPPPGVNIEEHIQIRQEEKRQRINRRHRLEEGRGTGKESIGDTVLGWVCVLGWRKG